MTQVHFTLNNEEAQSIIEHSVKDDKSTKTSAFFIFSPWYLIIFSYYDRAAFTLRRIRLGHNKKKLSNTKEKR